MKRTSCLLLVLVLLVGSNVLTYVAMDSQHQKQIENDGIVMANLLAIQNSRIAVRGGDLRVFNVLPPGGQPGASRIEGEFTVEDVNIDLLGNRPYWERYYEMYNAKIRRAPQMDDVDWQVHLAVKNAKARGEWKESKQEAAD